MTDDIINAILDDGINNYSFEKKYELKNKKPCPVLHLTVADGKTTRKFQFVWYSKYKWLTGSQVRNKLYCFYCLLLRREKTWSNEGVKYKKFRLKSKQTCYFWKASRLSGTI